jgi:hypothetical protein
MLKNQKVFQVNNVNEIQKYNSTIQVIVIIFVLFLETVILMLLAGVKKGKISKIHVRKLGKSFHITT